MIERLRTRAQSLTPAGQATTLAFVFGILFLLAYAVSRYQNNPPYIPIAYLVIGLIGLGLNRVQTSRPAEQILYAFLGITTAFGLFLITLIVSSNVWWMALIMAALLSTLVAAQFSQKTAGSLALIHMVGALAGTMTILGPGSLAGDIDTMILGLGLLIFGQAAIILFASKSQNGETSPKTSPFALDLNHMVMQLHVTVDGLVRAVEAINHIGTLQSEGASEQAEWIGRTNERLSDFLELSSGIREQARSITVMAQQAAEMSQNGQGAIQQAIKGMDDIRAQVSAIASTILTLAQFTQRIDEIISSVSEIATQSNLLALNASIEAARAGAHGRGFAVVADEVRSLSQQSTQAARQVRAILGEIQNAMKETIQATEVGLQGVDGGVTMTQQADKLMVQLANNVNASHEAVRHIYEVILEQVNGLEEIAIGIERIDRITQQNLTSTSTVMTVSTELTRLAADLQATVGMSAELASVEHYAEDNREQDAGEAERDSHEHSPAQQRTP